MEDYIEARQGDMEDPKIEKISYEDLFPEENPDDFETILDHILEQQEDYDLETAVEEAEIEFTRRTGKKRSGSQ